MSKISKQLNDIKIVNYPIHTSSKDKEDSNVGIYNPLVNNPRICKTHDDTCWSGIGEPIPLPYVKPEPSLSFPSDVLNDYGPSITIPAPVKHGKEYVKDPPHYHSKCSDAEMKAIIDRINKRGYIQAIDVIDTFFKDNFNLGTVFRYISRLGGKDDELTEIDKASWYLNHERENIIAKRK